MIQRPHSVFTMSITPFKDDLSLDEGALRAHVRRMVAAQTGLMVAGPGVGEGWTLTPREVRRVVEISVEEARGKVPVWMTARDSSTAAIAYEQIKEAIAAGVDVIRIYAAQYGLGQPLSEREQEGYWTELLDEIDVPVCIAPIHATYATPLALIERLVKRYPRIAWVHLGSDPNEIIEWRRALPDRIGILSTIFNAPYGASASISWPQNVIPNTWRTIAEAWSRGDPGSVMDLYLRWERFHLDAERLFTGGRTTARITKGTMKIVGLGNGVPRRPLLPTTEEEQRIVASALDRAGIPEWEELRRATRAT